MILPKNELFDAIIRESSNLQPDRTLIYHDFGEQKNRLLHIQKSPLYDGKNDNEVTLHLYEETSGASLEHSWFVPIEELREVLDHYYHDDFTMSSEKICSNLYM